MRGSEFFAALAGKSQGAWDANAYALAQQGGLMLFPWVDVPVTGGGHSGVIHVRSDVLSVGEGEDQLRLPLFPSTAQAILNLSGSLLPTAKMARAIYAAATVKLQPVPMKPNLYSNLRQYVDHNALVQDQLRTLGKLGSGELTSGQGKDVVVDASMPKGKVIIYGWFDPTGFSREATLVSPEGFRYVQPLSSVHADNYLDYSQLYREVRGDMTVDGTVMHVEDVLRSPSLWSLLADRGPLTNVRYPAPNTPEDVPNFPAGEGVYSQGIATLSALGRGGGGT